MPREVEILKIGTVLPSTIKDRYTIMVVYNGGPIFDYYINILKEKCGNDYAYLKTEQSIVGTPRVYKGMSNGKFKMENKMIGIINDEPSVGISFNLGYWHTSTVTKIVDESIFLTMNSAYAIHDISKLREKRLNDLGI